MGKFDGKVALVAGNLGAMKNGEFAPGLGNEVAKRLVEEAPKLLSLTLISLLQMLVLQLLGTPLKL